MGRTNKIRFVYAVMVPSDTGLDGLYGRASDAISRLKEYGPVPAGAVSDLRGGAIVYVQAEDTEESETHAIRLQVF